MSKNIILATGMPQLNTLFRHEKFASYHVKETVTNREELMRAIDRNQQDLHIVLVSDALPGKSIMTQLLVNIRMTHNHVRIIYLTADVNKNDERRMNRLSTLVMVGIYDIIASSKMTPLLIAKSLSRQNTREDIEWVTRYIDKSESQGTPQQTIEVTVEEEVKNKQRSMDGLENVFLFSSIKPGTGKSFISSNIAAMIAKYGKKRADGSPPRVALIDSDLQNLSLGTLLQLEDPRYNLKTVMDRIRTILDKKGNEINNPALVHDTKAFIKSSFLPYSRISNLEALVGSQLTMDQIEGIKADEFVYLINTIKDEYDVIIVDSNSSLAHVSTIPLLAMSRSSYYILNLDFNNVRNNSRYQSVLDEMGVLPRVKYILNENLTNEMVRKQGGEEELIFLEEHVRDNGFDLVGSVPLIDKPVFLNHIYEGMPIALDEQAYTLEARIGLAKIASDIWEIDKLPYMEDQLAREIERENAGKKKGLFGRK